jgi:hypothetical protein
MSCRLVVLGFPVNRVTFECGNMSINEIEVDRLMAELHLKSKCIRLGMLAY